MNKNIIHTDYAPGAIGPYSQAVNHNGLVFVSGQIPLDPASMEMVAGSIEAQITQVFDNLSAICKAADGSLNDILKLTVYLTDMGNFPQVNAIMEQYFATPFPARAAVGVAALPKGAEVEMDAILAV
ncbi:MAG: RidA family protein [Gammaproteobacteria bacterium]|nr:MAG: RidA family protein [Gammaproteobacteria bacterium]